MTRLTRQSSTPFVPGEWTYLRYQRGVYGVALALGNMSQRHSYGMDIGRKVGKEDEDEEGKGGGEGRIYRLGRP